jgi:GNAT superfamily N-acetyltransferase
MKILKATKKELKEIANVFSIVYSEEPYNEKWLHSHAIKKIEKYFNEGIIFIAKENQKIIGAIIGHLIIWDKYLNGFGDEFFVLKEYRNKNVGKKLALKLENYFKKNKVKYFVINANPKSKAFKIYQKNGFKESKNYIILEKKLK